MSATAFFLLRACGEGAVGSSGRACCPTVSPTRECWCILTACGEGAVGSTFRTCCPTVNPTRECWCILSPSDGIWNMLFSTFSHTSQWVGFSGSFRHTCGCSLLRSTFCFVSLTVFHLGVFFSRVNVCCAMFQAKCLHQFVLLFLNSLIMCTAEEATASDILVGAQPRIVCWIRARSSSSEVFETATARRQQRVEDATRVGQQFSFRSERRGRGAPSIAMKWRVAVNAAIMHGPLLPDVTLDVPCWWQPGMPLLRPTGHNSLVPPKRKRDMSAEPKTDQAVVRGLTRLSCACPWQDVRLQHSLGEAAGAGALLARATRHIPQMSGEPKRGPHEGSPQWIVFSTFIR